MRLSKTVLPASLLLFVTLALTGCGFSLAPLQVIVDATAAALPVLEATGVPIPAQVVTYVGDVANCIGSLTTAPNASQIATVSTCLTGQVAPQLTGLSKTIVTAIGVVVQAVQQFLTKAPAMQAQVAKVKTLTPAQNSQIATMQSTARVTAFAAKRMVEKK